MSSTSRPRDSFLLIITFLGFGLWLAAIGPVRTWASSAGISSNWIFGVAPSFLAGFTFVVWQAFAMRTRAVTAAIYTIVLIALIEASQIFLPHYTADVWDVIAGAIGSLLAAPIVSWRAKRRGAPTLSQ